MSDFNINISDQEIRDLLKVRLLEENEDTLLSQQLITMEQQLAFTTNPTFTPSLGQEQALLNKLKAGKHLLTSSLNKWLLVLLGAVSIVAAFFIFIQGNNQSFPSKKALSPILQEKMKANPTEEVTNTEINKPVVPQSENAKQSFVPLTLALDTLEKTASKPQPSLLLQPAVPHHTIKPVRAISPALQPQGKHFTPEEVPVQVDFIFQGIRKVEVEGGICQVQITGSDRIGVHLKGAIEMNDKKKKRKKNKYELKHKVEGEVLKVWVENKKSSRSIHIKTKELTAYINLEVPKKMDITVSNSTGDISVKHLTGNICDLNCNIGNIEATDIKCNLSAKASSGDIELRKIKGDVWVKTSLGNQTFEEIGGNLKTTNSSGDITVQGLTGTAQITSSLGNTFLKECKEDVYVKSSSGNIKADLIGGKMCDLNTSLGNITVSNTTSQLIAITSSGDIDLYRIKGDVKLKTSLGNLKIQSVKGNVNAKTSSGKIYLNQIKGNITSTTGLGRIRLIETKGSLNLKTTAGDITGSEITLNANSEFTSHQGNINLSLVNASDELSFDLSTKLGILEVQKNGVTQKEKDHALLIEKGNIRIKGVTNSGNQKYK